MLSMHHPSAELPPQLHAHTRTRDPVVVCDDVCVYAILTPCTRSGCVQCAARAVRNAGVHLERVASIGTLSHANCRL